MAPGGHNIILALATLTFSEWMCLAMSGMLDLSRRAIRTDSLLYSLEEREGKGGGGGW